jgi:hypothetical protein
MLHTRTQPCDQGVPVRGRRCISDGESLPEIVDTREISNRPGRRNETLPPGTEGQPKRTSTEGKGAPAVRFSHGTSGKSSGLLGTTVPGEKARKLLVRMGRLELPRPCERWNLNPVRLPIPPHPLAEEKLLQGNISRQPPARSAPAALVFRKLRNSCGLRVSCGNVAMVF